METISKAKVGTSSAPNDEEKTQLLTLRNLFLIHKNILPILRKTKLTILSPGLQLRTQFLHRSIPVHRCSTHCVSIPLVHRIRPCASLRVSQSRLVSSGLHHLTLLTILCKAATQLSTAVSFRPILLGHTNKLHLTCSLISGVPP